MLINAFAILLVLVSAIASNFSTRKAEPRLPLAAGCMLAGAPLLLAFWLMAARMSVFVSIMAVLTLWMLALPLVGALRAMRKARTGRTHG